MLILVGKGMATMCKIDDAIQNCVEYEAKKLVPVRHYLYDDLVQVAMLRISRKGRAGQVNAYYQKIARTTMLQYIKKEQLRGIVVNAHGGDRRSEDFGNRKKSSDELHVVSIDTVPEEFSRDHTCSGRKTPVVMRDEDVGDDGARGSDAITERWLRGGSLW